MKPEIHPHIAHEGEHKRLAGQNLRILERLERGRASNRELSAISLKYTGRISEIRVYLKPRGKDVKVVSRDRDSGLTWYAIVDSAPVAVDRYGQLTLLT